MNKELTSSILETLSKDGSTRVRQSVASNPNSSPEILEALSKDKDESVRHSVASNPNTPITVINEYAGLKK